jgi:hypothetical protein
MAKTMIPVFMEWFMKLQIILVAVALAVSAFGQSVPVSSPQSSAPLPNSGMQDEGAVLNARQFPGGDIGAQVNAAGVRCGRGNVWEGNVCHIVIPPSGRVTLTTPILMVDGEEMECSRSGYIADGQHEPETQLEYKGSEIAVTMNGRGDTLRGCGLRLGEATDIGVLMGGHSNYASQISEWRRDRNDAGARVWGRIEEGYGRYASGRFAADKFFRDWSGNRSCERHVPDAYYCLWRCPYRTGRTLVIDSAAGGTNINDVVGGDSGLHGLVVQNTLSGGPPTWIFANNFQAHCSTGSGWLFDATLGSAMIGVTFLNSWSSGAGGCGTVTPGVAGIEVAGGVNIHIGGGSKIRSNFGDGVLVDGKGVNNLQIEGNMITGNGFCKQRGAAVYSGIHITAPAHTVQIVGNTIGNTFNDNENQLYGVNVEAGVAG